MSTVRRTPYRFQPANVRLRSFLHKPLNHMDHEQPSTAVLHCFVHAIILTKGPRAEQQIVVTYSLPPFDLPFPLPCPRCPSGTFCPSVAGLRGLPSALFPVDRPHLGRLSNALVLAVLLPQLPALFWPQPDLFVNRAGQQMSSSETCRDHAMTKASRRPNARAYLVPPQFAYFFLTLKYSFTAPSSMRIPAFREPSLQRVRLLPGKSL